MKSFNRENWDINFWECLNSPIACWLSTVGAVSIVPYFFGLLGWFAGVACLQCESWMNATGKRNDGLGACITTGILGIWGFGALGAAYNRTKFRELYRIRGNMWIDCLFYTCCMYSCAAVQEYKEARDRKIKSFEVVANEHYMFRQSSKNDPPHAYLDSLND